jgi:aminoglycoside phosphotransferase family enzyme/predicted kinase
MLEERTLRRQPMPPSPPPSSGEPPSLFADLARPEAFPPPRPRRVTVATTHASWVFLTETEAWKVKRPVDFGFLDFSTADKRRRCCEDEVRLGSRLAPGVYRGVAPVYLAAHGHTLTGPGAVVDHAVRMARLRDEDSAAARLATGQLGPPELRRLALRLAPFYAAAATTPELGAPSVLAANVAENEQQLRPYLDRLVDRAGVEALHRWQRAQLAARDDQLRARVSAGRIREGHGDLRLEHVYFPAPGDPVIIDPIEFNRAFRCADVALDVAFLAMELDDAGRPDLSACFLSCFAAAAHDYDFYPLLDLYLSYRAEVRAKVACLVAGDGGTAPDKARRKAADAARLLALALSYGNGGKRTPHVVAVGGEIGTGKSTVAEALGLALCQPVVSSDAVRKQLAGLAPNERGGPELYTPEATRRTYARMLACARPVLASRRGVILDATFRTEASRAAARELAQDSGVPFLLVELVGSDEQLRERLRRREGQGGGLSDAREAHLPQLRRQYQPPHELGGDERLQLDARLPPEVLAARIAGAVARPTRS